MCTDGSRLLSILLNIEGLMPLLWSLRGKTRVAVTIYMALLTEL